MKVLVITDALWRNDNGVGNSYSNIFNNIEEIEIANICLSGGNSKNDISKKCFQISEGSLIANLKNKKNPSGRVEEFEDGGKEEKEESKIMTAIKRSRLQIFFWIRNLIWKLGRWKSKELKKFIDDFKPDLIFAQVQDKIYLNNIITFVQKYTGKPLFLYAWDDVYSLKQFSWSPLFWIDRFFQRSSIRRLVKRCKILYTISEEQRIEYNKTLKVETKLLYKGYDFIADTTEKEETNSPIKILYTGNLYSGRYGTIKRFCEDLQSINQDKQIAELDIYSATALTDKQKEGLNIKNSSRFLGKVSEEKVQELQKSADVLLHIEPFSLKGSLLCRLSFSTKLVDYFYNKKCIFAIGHKRCSSIKYLKRYDASIVVDNLKDIKGELERLLHHPELLTQYREKAWKCGYNNHQISSIQQGLLEDFNKYV